MMSMLNRVELRGTCVEMQYSQSLHATETRISSSLMGHWAHKNDADLG